MKLASTVLAALLAASSALPAAQVAVSDPQSGGIGYKYTVTMGGLDTAVFSNHVGAWSWEDNSLFDAGAGEEAVGWTHTSHWVALNVTTTAVFKIRVERDATMPWPSSNEPNRLASTASMYPSFTIWKNWDNDLAPFPEFQSPSGEPINDVHTYNNHGNVDWAEDLVYEGNLNNSTAEFIEQTYVLPSGKYTIVLGSNAPATDSNRQGYKATFTTTQELPITIKNDTYFTTSAVKSLSVPVTTGLLANDVGVAHPNDTLEVVTQPQHGTVTVNLDGSFSYTPGQYFGLNGYDKFTYRLLLDGDPNTATPTGTVVVSTYAAAAGIYVGHIKDEDSGDTAGLVKMKVTPSGTFTSAVQHLGKRYALTGRFTQTGDMVLRGRNPLDLELHLSTHGDGDRHLHMHIHGDGAHFGSHVEKSPFSAQNPPPSVGRHRVALTYNTSSVGASTRNGSGLLTITRDGSASLAGVLGDRTGFSCATALVTAAGSGPIMPVYSSAYRARGSVSGTLTFGLAAESNATGTLRAVKPAVGANAGSTITYDAKTTVIAPARARR